MTIGEGGHHLSAFVIEVLTGLMNPYSTCCKVRFVHFFEALFSAINSLQTCIFTTYPYIPEKGLLKPAPFSVLRFAMNYIAPLSVRLVDVRTYSELYRTITGIPLSQRDMLKAGHRIHTLERYMNTREGIRRKDGTLPLRFLTRVHRNDPKRHVVPLERMSDQYYRMRGYDADGIPTPQILEKCQIEIK